MEQRGRARVERGQKRVRAYLGGELVFDTTTPLLVWESPQYPTNYIPSRDVKASLAPSGRIERSPSLGDAHFLDVKVKARSAGNVARHYPDSPIKVLRDHVRFEWDALDAWFEEDEPVYTHARDPYTRVDILASSRHVEVLVGSVQVADSRQPRILFETGLPPRYYLPLTDVRLDLLVPSDTRTHCPYKGTAAYWSLRVGDQLLKDMAWTYRTPFPECQKIAGLVAFHDEKLDLTLDGGPPPRTVLAR